MKTAILRLIWRLVLLLVIASCDSFLGDSIPNDTQVVFSQTDYYILPGTMLIMDIKSIIGSSWADATLSITENPVHGRLFPLDTLLLRYTPDVGFTEGNDQFVLSVLQNGKTLKTQTITVKLVETLEKISCDIPGIYAMGEFVITKQDSPVSIDFLRNDKVCGLDRSTLNVSIVSQPANGIAQLAGDAIIYTPADHFKGMDSIIYKISSDGPDLTPSAIVSSGMGFVSIHVLDATTANPCLEQVTDYRLDLTDNLPDIMEYDISCGTGYRDYFFPLFCPYFIDMEVVSKTSNSGLFCIGMNGALHYLPNPAGQPKNDTATVRIRIEGQIKEVSFYARREK